eukprot:12938235-Prorocentrum_lima.AAC.1
MFNALIKVLPSTLRHIIQGRIGAASPPANLVAICSGSDHANANQMLLSHTENATHASGRVVVLP